jgi:hypothetical protein
MSLKLTVICIQAFIMSTQFYLTLPSNSSMKYFPHNTVANFRVKLADRIVLPGQWEVALTGLHYPHTWSTVRTGVQQTFTYKVESKGHFETGVLKSTQFNTPTDLKYDQGRSSKN